MKLNKDLKTNPVDVHVQEMLQVGFAELWLSMDSPGKLSHHRSIVFSL